MVCIRIMLRQQAVGFKKGAGSASTFSAGTFVSGKGICLCSDHPWGRSLFVWLFFLILPQYSQPPPYLARGSSEKFLTPHHRTQNNGQLGVLVTLAVLQRRGFVVFVLNRMWITKATRTTPGVRPISLGANERLNCTASELFC